MGLDKNPENDDPIGLRDFVDAAKDGSYDILWGAAAEPLGPIVGGMGRGPRRPPIPSRPSPRGARPRFTKDIQEVYRRLDKYHKIPEDLASKRLHEIKDAKGLKGRDALLDLTGNVYHPDSGDLIGSMTTGGRGGYRGPR